MQVLNLIITAILEKSQSCIAVTLSAVLLLVILVVGHVHDARRHNPFNIADIACITFLFIQLVALSVSRSRPDSIHALQPFASASCVYMSIRMLQHWRRSTSRLIIYVMVCVGALFAIANLSTQFIAIRNAERIFSADMLASIHASFPLVGGGTKNDNLAVILSLLPYALCGALTRYKVKHIIRLESAIVATGLVIVLVLSFSRAVYAALIILSILSILVVARTKKAYISQIVIAAGIIVVTVVASVSYIGVCQAVIETINGNHTVTQQRSTRGRVEIWNESVSDIARHPLLGSGGGTDGLFALGQMHYSKYPFVVGQYNAAIDTMTCYGILGFTCYGVYFFYPIWMVARSFAKRSSGTDLSATIPILAAGLIALVTRDMMYSSIATHGFTIMIAWVTLALVQNSITHMPNNSILHRSFGLDILAYCSLGLVVVTVILSCRLESAEKYYVHGAIMLREGNYEGASREFDRAIEIECDQPMFYAADALAKVRSFAGTVWITQPLMSLPKLSKNDVVLLKSAEEEYKNALSLSADDSTFWSNLAWIESYLGNDDDAKSAYEHAIYADPIDVTSRIGYGMFYERRGLIVDAINEYAYAVAVSPRIIDSDFFADLRKRNHNASYTVLLRTRDILRQTPQSPIHTAISGKINAAIGNVMAARDEYADALRGLPNLPFTWSNLGMLNHISGKDDVAYNEFERALYLDDRDRVSANMLASIDFSKGKISSAEERYRWALLSPDFSDHAARTFLIYHLGSPTPDDIIPAGLVTYVSPKITPVAICGDWITNITSSGNIMPDASVRIKEQDDFCKSLNSAGVIY